MTPRFLLFFVALFVPAIVLSGCGGPERPADLPPLFSTKITVVQEGKPLEGAMVRLVSDDLSFAWIVAAITDASGVAEIMTHGQFSGAPLGTYKVVITKTEPENKGDIATARPDNESGEQVQVQQQKTLKLYTLLEKQYTQLTTTPLTITIQKGKNNEKFDVGKPLREFSENFVF